MKIISSPKKIASILKKERMKKRILGFVPTMGALHEGHLSLIRQARRENDIVVVSIFVNPAQFGPKEGFKKYPRPFRKDVSFCRKEKVDFIFSPKAQDMYSMGFRTRVYVDGLSELLCGKSRPGHFQGVTTVVAKLFNLILPDLVYFGQKDAQQALIIKNMVKELNFPIKIKVMPTLREPDGLAMSSRNMYLSEKERKDALVLFQSLRLAQSLVIRGNKNTKEIIKEMKGLIQKMNTASIDYISIVNPKSLKPLDKVTGTCLAALAVRFGKTRLIDNVMIRSRMKENG